MDDYPLNILELFLFGLFQTRLGLLKVFVLVSFGFKTLWIPPKNLSTKLGDLTPKPTFQQPVPLQPMLFLERIPAALGLFTLSLPRLMDSPVPMPLKIAPVATPRPLPKALPFWKDKNTYCFQNKDFFPLPKDLTK